MIGWLINIFVIRVLTFYEIAGLLREIADIKSVGKKLVSKSNEAKKTVFSGREEVSILCLYSDYPYPTLLTWLFKSI